MNFRATRILAAALLASSCGLAGAATAPPQTFAVTATVVSTCVITSAGAMAFGNYTPGAGPITQTSEIVVRCSLNTPYGIGLNAGTGAGSTTADRKMSTGSNVLDYSLSTVPGATPTNWENTTVAFATTGNQGGVGAGMNTPRNHTVYGLLPDSGPNQAALPAAGYTSTVTVTLTY